MRAHGDSRSSCAATDSSSALAARSSDELHRQTASRSGGCRRARPWPASRRDSTARRRVRSAHSPARWPASRPRPTAWRRSGCCARPGVTRMSWSAKKTARLALPGRPARRAAPHVRAARSAPRSRAWPLAARAATGRPRAARPSRRPRTSEPAQRAPCRSGRSARPREPGGRGRRAGHPSRGSPPRSAGRPA